MILNNVFLGLVAIGMLIYSDGVFFRSKALLNVTLRPVAGDYTMLDDDGNRVQVQALEDLHGVVFWSRRIKTEVCQTGECRLVDVGLYWDCTGDFFGLEVYGEHLTKTDHTIFSQHDYERLISILSNDWSILREYSFADLTVETPTIATFDPAPKKSDVDAASGATRKEIASEAVKDAVYTTYTLWHLVHSGEKEQLEAMTLELLKTGSLVEELLASSNKKYDFFLLSLLAQARIAYSDPLEKLIAKGLESVNDPLLQDLAVKALAHPDAASVEFQSVIGSIYQSSTPALKLRMLTSLRDVTQVHAELATAMERDLDVANEWLAAKILPLLMRGPAPSDSTVRKVRQLAASKNSQVEALAHEFLKEVND